MSFSNFYNLQFLGFNVKKSYLCFQLKKYINNHVVVVVVLRYGFQSNLFVEIETLQKNLGSVTSRTAQWYLIGFLRHVNLSRVILCQMGRNCIHSTFRLIIFVHFFPPHSPIE